ncbi:MAG: hypothetical protein Q7W05_11390, partial [Deltaproteobacteria bacterium]|nr:hypothetical protein [Deltaproteobacteria bacterium]
FILLVTVLAAGPVLAAKKETKPPVKAETPQEETAPAGIYKYLPEESGQQASFTKADYIALKLTAYNSRAQGISARLICNSLQCFAWPDSLVINAYLELQEKERASYLGAGKFSYPQADLKNMMQETVNYVQKTAHLYFDSLNDKYLVINLYMKGSQLAGWKDFNLDLKAEGKKEAAKD